jgi:hypothetical protein
MFDRLDGLGTWAVVADPRAWLLILLLAAATFGRSGLFRSRWLDLLKPYRRRPAGARGRPAEAKAPTHPLRDPLFLFLLVVSAAAVSTWIIMTLTATGTRRP